MKVILRETMELGHQTESEVLYYGEKTGEELKQILRELWEKILNAPDYDLDANEEEYWYEENPDTYWASARAYDNATGVTVYMEIIEVKEMKYE